MKATYSNNEITYVPDNSLKHGFLSIFAEIYSELIDNRWLAFQLFKRDFVSMQKQSLIGTLWIVIVPIINVSIFAMLNSSGVLNVGNTGVPYPLFALLGMSFWQIFASVLTSSGSALTAAEGMITRINFSKKCLIIASIGKPIIAFFIQFILIAALFVFYRISPAKTILLAPFILIPLILLSLGLGFIIAILNAIIKDTGTFLTYAVSLMMYATPVLYAKPMKGLLLEITKYNPAYYLLSAGRDLALEGKIVAMNGFLWSMVISVVIFIVTIVAFHLTETRIAERI